MKVFSTKTHDVCAHVKTKSMPSELPKDCQRGERKVKRKAFRAKKGHRKFATARKKTGGGKKPDVPKATTAKMIELFETDPSFSGI